MSTVLCLLFTSVPDPYVFEPPGSASGPLDGGTDPRIRIRSKMSLIHNTGLRDGASGEHHLELLQVLRGGHPRVLPG
jgi:hypothetical protein